MRALFLAMTAMAMVACGGAVVTGGGDSNGNQNIACTVTATGGASGTGNCGKGSAAYVSSTNKGSVALQGPIGSNALSFIIGFDGEPVAKTYKNTDTGIAAAISVGSGSSYWISQIDPHDPADNTGSFTLAITSVSTVSTNSQGKVYLIHGTMDATTLGAGTASGSTTVHASF